MEFFSYVLSRFGYPLVWCPFNSRTCVPSSEIQSLAGILQCTCLFSVRVLPFLVPLYPRPCVPGTKIKSMAGILQYTCLAFSSVVTFSGAPLPTPTRLKHKDSAAGWYPEVHVSVFSSGVTFSLVPVYPRSCIPSTEIQSMAGILPCTCLFLARMLPFWSSITHAHCIPSTEIQSLAGILQCAFFSSPVRVLPILESLPLFSAFPCTSTFCPAV